jgi:hypothetical protein
MNDGLHDRSSLTSRARDSDNDGSANSDLGYKAPAMKESPYIPRARRLFRLSIRTKPDNGRSNTC